MMLDDVASYLTAYGATDVNWPIYKGFLPDDASQAIAVFETGGYPPDTMERESENVTFQLRVRAARLDYVVGRAKWKQIFDLLQDAQHTTSPTYLSGYTFIQALHFGPLAFSDDKGRPNFCTNWRVKKARS